MKSKLSRFILDESGATAIEYGLIAAMIGIVIVAALTTISGGLNGIYNTLSNSIGPH